MNQRPRCPDDFHALVGIASADLYVGFEYLRPPRLRTSCSPYHWGLGTCGIWAQLCARAGQHFAADFNDETYVVGPTKIHQLGAIGYESTSALLPPKTESLENTFHDPSEEQSRCNLQCARSPPPSQLALAHLGQMGKSVPSAMGIARNGGPASEVLMTNTCRLLVASVHAYVYAVRLPAVSRLRAAVSTNFRSVRSFARRQF